MSTSKPGDLSRRTRLPVLARAIASVSGRLSGFRVLIVRLSYPRTPQKMKRHYPETADLRHRHRLPQRLYDFSRKNFSVIFSLESLLIWDSALGMVVYESVELAGSP